RSALEVFRADDHRRHLRDGRGQEVRALHRSLVVGADREGRPRRRGGEEREHQTYLLVTGRDGYTGAPAIGERDPPVEGKSVILAYDGGEPAASRTALRLVVPGDVHGGRSVRDVATIEVR